MGSNDAAVKKAENLAKTHGIQAIAYKVDSELGLKSDKLLLCVELGADRILSL